MSCNCRTSGPGCCMNQKFDYIKKPDIDYFGIMDFREAVNKWMMTVGTTEPDGKNSETWQTKPSPPMKRRLRRKNLKSPSLNT